MQPTDCELADEANGSNILGSDEKKELFESPERKRVLQGPLSLDRNNQLHGNNSDTKKQQKRKNYKIESNQSEGGI